MPSPRHDALVSLFKEHPELAVEILRDLKEVELPNTPLVQFEKTTFNTRPSDDIEPDLIFVMGPQQEAAHAIIVEIQQDKSKDPRQLARYAAALWLMLRCDVTVLVICPDHNVATHYAQPIESGLTGYRLQAFVLGPDDVPAITDPQEAAAHLALSTLSLMVHGRNRKVVQAFASAMADTQDDHAPKYYDYAYSMAAPAIRRLLEEIMTSTDWPVQSPFLRQLRDRGLKEGVKEGMKEGIKEGRKEGRKEGETKEAARMVLLVLATRGLDVPDDARARITTCTDLAQLEAWAARAVTAQTIQDLFTEPGEHRS